MMLLSKEIVRMNQMLEHRIPQKEKISCGLDIDRSRIDL